MSETQKATKGWPVHGKAGTRSKKYKNSLLNYEHLDLISACKMFWYECTIFCKALIRPALSANIIMNTKSLLL